MKQSRVLKIIVTLILSFSILSNLSCKEDIKLPPVDNSIESENGNFTLYVSNQSFEVSKVDIQIKIDGKVVVSDLFDVGNQHNWKGFVFSLAKGTHTLEVRSDQEDVNLTEEFEITEKNWAVVDFWYYPESHYEPTERHFSFHISDEPIYFD